MQNQCYTVSSPDVSGTITHYRTHDAVLRDKSPTENCCCVSYREETKQSQRPILEFSPAPYLHGSYFLSYRSADVFLRFFICHLYLSVARLDCSLSALSSTSWEDTPLTADCILLQSLDGSACILLMFHNQSVCIIYVDRTISDHRIKQSLF